MAKGVLVVQTAPVAGREDEYNDWYNDVHLVEILKLAGFTSARRFRKVQDDPLPYLAIYEIEADDLEEAQASLGKASAAGEMNISSALGLEPAPILGLFEQIAERQA